MHLSALSRGAVLLRAGQSHVVCALSGDGSKVVLAPITPRDLPYERGDVRISSVADMAALGLVGGDWLIRVSRYEVIDRTKAGSVTGKATPSLLARIIDAIAIEAEARSNEDKWRAAGSGKRVMQPGCRSVGQARFLEARAA